MLAVHDIAARLQIFEIGRSLRAAPLATMGSAAARQLWLCQHGQLQRRQHASLRKRCHDNMGVRSVGKACIGIEHKTQALIRQQLMEPIG